MSSHEALGSIVPTLREVREGWGTRLSGIKHFPETFAPCRYRRGRLRHGKSEDPLFDHRFLRESKATPLRQAQGSSVAKCVTRVGHPRSISIHLN